MHGVASSRYVEVDLSSGTITQKELDPRDVALYVGGWAIAQLWLFWVAPIAGAVMGGLLYRFLGKE